jgi:quinolinate synthase
LKELKQEHKNAKVVTYVNSSVDIKAESDVCCTSANAVSVVKNIDADEVIFIPDRNLGTYVGKMVPEKKIILFEGYCYVHDRIKKEEIEEMRNFYPEAEFLVHPEARMEVINLADKVFSTSGMLKYAKKSDKKQFVIITEQGLIERLKRENPEKEFYPAVKPKICSNMKRTALIDIFNSLEKNQYEINIEESILQRAYNALNKMLRYI